MNRNRFGRKTQILVFVLFDIVLLNLASFFAVYSRMDFSVALAVEEGFFDHWLEFSVVYTICSVILFFFMKLYSSLWEFAGEEEIVQIVLASCVIALAEWIAISLHVVQLPRSFPILNGVYLCMLLAIERFSYRMLRSILHNWLRRGGRRTMLIGAGSAGLLALNEFQNSDKSQNKVVCVIDDDPSKHGKYIRGVKVMGGRESIVTLAEKMRIEEIIFAIPTATGKERREILTICQQTSAKLKTLPAIYQLTNGEVSIQRIREVDVLELLGRDSVQIDLSELTTYLKGKRVLVTGGGGSIGSELCRQIAARGPAKLIIFDIYENNAYLIQQELLHKFPTLQLKVVIGSVRDAQRVDMLFAQEQPEIVFHAAAHKHVPLMEGSPNEAIKNNVFGTLYVAQAAKKYQVGTFVFISTDKAVNPTNIMGASKRICEMIVQMMANHSQTKFAAVRFGNVLGSNGSVIPLFKRQIAEGGPVTVTHKDIIRYFMTIPEAVALVLQAGFYAKHGEIFVLDMGEPVRIDDLARNMIRLSGFEPETDIQIQYTGLRPGEKLYEEMLMDEEGMRTTANQLIYIGKPLEIDEEKFCSQLKTLHEACENNSDHIKDLVAEMIPTYHKQP